MFRAAPPPDSVDGVKVRVSARARRLSLRANARTGEVELVWPQKGRTTERAALRFIEAQQDWIARQRAKAPPPAVALRVLGRECRIVQVPGRGVSRIEGDVVTVRGDAAHFPRRLQDALKKEAERVLIAAVREKADGLGLPPRAVRVRDPASRWGSCGVDGRIMLSWRLIMVPPEVLDYVVAHEVAHRVHLNHGRAFWALCAKLSTDASGARRWLKTHGPALMAWRPPSGEKGGALQRGLEPGEIV
jgi:predicted metal-dependent hydrolase